LRNQSLPRQALSDYEELPELKASEILRPEILKGPYHQVREAVPTFSGANQFTIDSDFGIFEAEGNQTLLMRINEINAIARLKEVSRTDEFKNALVKAAKSPVAAAKAIVTDPVHAVTNVPKGIMKFIGRSGENVKHVGEKHEGKDPQGSKMQQIIGFSAAKRKVALSLGVDPYSTNTVLQRRRIPRSRPRRLGLTNTVSKGYQTSVRNPQLRGRKSAITGQIWHSCQKGSDPSPSRARPRRNHRFRLAFLAQFSIK
jgi:hypothetical protein